MNSAIIDLLVGWMSEIQNEIDRWNERLTDKRWTKSTNQEVIETIILKLETRLAFLHRVIKKASEEEGDNA